MFFKGCVNCEGAMSCPDAFKPVAMFCNDYDNGPKADNVHHPYHYQTYIDGLETIDMIYAVLGPERFEGYCRGNALKYLARADDKGNTIEDLEKAIVYINWEIEIRKESK